MTILELREKRNTAWNAAKAFLDSHRTEKGTLTAEDDATYSRMEQEIADLGKEIARLERQEALDAELSKPVNKPLTSKPVTATEKPAKIGRASDEYKNGMLQALRTNFRQVSNILQEGVDADGGYLVPEEYDSRLIDVLTEENIMRSLGHTITTSGEHKINIAATKPAAAWIEEGGALQFSDATFSQILLDAHKLHVAIKVTEELLYDNAFGLDNYIIHRRCPAPENLHHRLSEQNQSQEQRSCASILCRRQPRSHYSEGHLLTGSRRTGPQESSQNQCQWQETKL